MTSVNNFSHRHSDFFELDWCLCGFSLCPRTGMWGELTIVRRSGSLQIVVCLSMCPCDELTTCAGCTPPHPITAEMCSSRTLRPCDPEFRRKRRHKMKEWMSGWLLCCTDLSYLKKKLSSYDLTKRTNLVISVCLFAQGKKTLGHFHWSKL